jgi:hypothetical protein
MRSFLAIPISSKVDIESAVSAGKQAFKLWDDTWVPINARMLNTYIHLPFFGVNLKIFHYVLYGKK